MNSIVDYLDRWALARPDVCVSCFHDGAGRETDRYTYRRLAERTRAVAGRLRRVPGLARGDRVLLVFPPGLEIIVAFLACARRGLIPVPVAPPTRTQTAIGLARLGFIAADCGARHVLGTAAFLATHAEAGSAFSSAVRASQRNELIWIATDDVDVDDAEAANDEPGDILFLQYTSGSTSEPKGVIVSHENVVRNALSIITHVPIAVSWLPQYHDMGLIGYYLFPLIGGGTTYGFAPMDFLKRPLLWFELIRRHRATDTSAPNFGFEYCLREDKVPTAQLADVDLRSLRVLMNAAEPVNPRTYRTFLDRFRACGLQPAAHVAAYGLAEGTLAAAHYGRRVLAVDRTELARNCVREVTAKHPQEQSRQLVSCGRPLPGVTVRIVDHAAGTPLDEDRVGEIWLSGPACCLGYWQQPERTREIFRARLRGADDDATEYLRTGDLGFLHGGELFVCGRVKDLLILRGVNLHPQDIEASVAAAAPQLRPLGLAAFNGVEEGESLVIVAELKDPRELPDFGAIGRAIRLQHGVHPREIVLVPPGTVARTTSGKNARALTRRRFLAGELPVLATHVFTAARLPDTVGESVRRRFELILGPYDLTETEEQTLAEVGLDSLAFVDLILAVKALLAERGAVDLMASLDAPLLQRFTVAEFFELLRRFETEAGGPGFASWRHLLERRQDEQRLAVETRMRADAVLELDGESVPAPPPGPPAAVLLTGATGFFGPHLLSSLLRHTSMVYHVLVRATDAEHGERRVCEGLKEARLWDPATASALRERVRIVCGDLARPYFGWSADQWDALAGSIDTVLHSAALVNYLWNYEALRPANVEGTREALRFAATGRPKAFHHVSSTFIYGWTAKGRLFETDDNAGMANLDFGYAQTKWVAEQLVHAAGRRGLRTRVYRPSLISASSAGVWDRGDIAVRLLAFMINQRMAVHTRNQISFLPADLVADHLALILRTGAGTGDTLHVTADDYYNFEDVTELISAEHGYTFTYYEIPEFIAEMNRRSTSGDLLYPLLDFFNRSFEKITAMQLKRYDNTRYRAARTAAGARPPPALRDIVAAMMEFLRREKLIAPARTATGGRSRTQKGGATLGCPAVP